jgi:hypothetical protein
MKKIFLILMTTSLCISASAQLTLTAATYFPNAGDTLRMLTASANTITNIVMTAPSATQQTWNYTFLRSPTRIPTTQTFLNATTDTAAQSAFPGVDLITQQGMGGTQTACYNKTLTRFELMGFKGFRLQALNMNLNPTFSPFVPERRAPLIYNTGNNNLRYSFLIEFPASMLPDSLLAALPIRPDSLRVNFATIRTDRVDAWGTMQIPGGTFDVLRERRFTIDETRLEMKVNLLRMWIDITPILFSGVAQGNPSRDTTVSYYFWSNTAKEPIVVANMNPTLDSAKSVQYKYFPVSPIENVSAANDKIKIYPNPAYSEFYLEILEQGTYVVTLTDALGRVVSTQTIENTGINIVPISNLQSGIYWVMVQKSTGERLISKSFVKQ